MWAEKRIQMSSCVCVFPVVSLRKPSSVSALVLVYSVVKKCKILWPCIYLTPLVVSFLFICFQCVLHQKIYRSFLYMFINQVKLIKFQLQIASEYVYFTVCIPMAFGSMSRIPACYNNKHTQINKWNQLDAVSAFWSLLQDIEICCLSFKLILRYCFRQSSITEGVTWGSFQQQELKIKV